MPKIICKCNKVIDYGQIPSKHDYLFIADTEYDKYNGMIDSEKLYNQMKTFIKCPNCQRIWIFWDSFQKPPKEYLPIKNSEVE